MTSDDDSLSPHNPTNSKLTTSFPFSESQFNPSAKNISSRLPVDAIYGGNGRENAGKQVANLDAVRF
jgi:hypothetical protein